MTIDFADYVLGDIFGKPDLSEIKLEYCLWMDVESAFED